MPLSDREEQLLKEMEGSLKTERTPAKHQGKGGMVLLGAGFVMLLAGATLPLVVLGVAGYLVMLGGLVLFYQSRSADGMKGKLNARIQQSAQERRNMRKKSA